MYSYLPLFEDTIEDLKNSTVLPPGLERSDLVVGMNFEFHPVSRELMYGWIHDSSTEFLWLFIEGKWEEYGGISTENLAEYLISTIEKLDSHITRQDAQGCGVIVETLFSIRTNN
jgi:hypothetical protein